MQVQGPATLCLGDFVNERVGWTGEPPELTAQGGFFRRYGFDDATTARYVTQLAQQGLPDFTLACFPDNDYASHKVGPLRAVGTIEEFDEFLGNLDHQWDSLPKMKTWQTGDQLVICPCWAKRQAFR